MLWGGAKWLEQFLQLLLGGSILCHLKMQVWLWALTHLKHVACARMQNCPVMGLWQGCWPGTRLSETWDRLRQADKSLTLLAPFLMLFAGLCC